MQIEDKTDKPFF